MERTLASFGIQTWEQIAAFTAADIEKVSAAIEAFPGRIERDDWVGGSERPCSAAGHTPGEHSSSTASPVNRRKKRTVKGESGRSADETTRSEPTGER